MKERADLAVLRLGLAGSRQKARALIMAGRVYADGDRIEKPGQMLDLGRNISLKEGMRYVSRGGLKLEEALHRFSIDLDHKTGVDLGASTGGFTDCLLQHGAERVYAVDVDTRQIDWQLSKDPRVILIRKNARYLDKGDFEHDVDIVTMDLSFISVLKVLPSVERFLYRGCIVCLVKPQFEAGKGQVGKKGIVKDRHLHEEILNRTIQGARDMGFYVLDILRASVRGQKGNQEYFVHLGHSPKLDDSRTRTLVKEEVWNDED